MKKFLLIVLILAIASFAFASGNRQQQQSAAASGDVISIWSIQVDGKSPQTTRASIARFEAANPGIKVNLTLIPNDNYKALLAVAMAAGTTPDLFISWSGGPMYEYANNNQILDLTSYMNAHPAFKNKLLDAGIAQGTYNGKIYGVPSTNVSPATVFYNKEIFQRLNLRVPTTVAELETVSDTLKANGITPFSLANLTQWTGSMYFMYLATRHGGTQPFISAVDGSGSFTHPAFIYAGQKIQEWVNKGYFLPGFNGFDWDSGQGRPPLYRGETAMLLMGSWFVAQAKDESPEFYSKMGTFAFPRVDGGSGNPATVIGTIGDNFYHVNAASRNPAKAFELITYLLDDQGVKDMVAEGKIPPVKGLTFDDPILREVMNQVNNAPDIQLWYDQSLSPEVAEVHKVTSQEIFGLTKTPDAAAQELQNAQQAYIRRNR